MNRIQKPTYVCEVEVTEGLEFVTEAELKEYDAHIIRQRPGEIDFHFLAICVGY